MRYAYGNARELAAVALFYTLLLPSAGFAGVGCPGDCDQNGKVTIDELITAVKISLKTAPLSMCPRADRNNDGKVSIVELQKAIIATTNDCQFCGPNAQCGTNDTKMNECGACGTQSFACNDQCRWTKNGPCEGQKECEKGAMDTQSCSAPGFCPQKTRTCQDDCTWGPYSACTAAGVCSPNSTRSCDGTGTQICDDHCQWNPFCICPGVDAEGCTACPAGDYVSGFDCTNQCPGGYASNKCTPVCGNTLYSCGGGCPPGYTQGPQSQMFCNACAGGPGTGYAYTCTKN